MDKKSNIVKESDIANCRFSFKCSMAWRELSKVEHTETVRYCNQCETAVHLCTTDREFEDHAAKGHCVALVYFRVRAQTDALTTVGRPLASSKT